MSNSNSATNVIFQSIGRWQTKYLQTTIKNKEEKRSLFPQEIHVR